MPPRRTHKLPMPPPDHTLSYGQDTNQIGELRLPAGPGPHPIIVLVHGCRGSDVQLQSFVGGTVPIARIVAPAGVKHEAAPMVSSASLANRI